MARKARIRSLTLTLIAPNKVLAHMLSAVCRCTVHLHAKTPCTIKTEVDAYGLSRSVLPVSKLKDVHVRSEGEDSYSSRTGGVFTQATLSRPVL
jgi:hypothetical protein